MPRPVKPRCIGFRPEVVIVTPLPRCMASGVHHLHPDEAEALRLVDYLGLTQMEAAGEMKVSRATLWRILRSARRKMVSTIVEGRALIVQA